MATKCDFCKGLIEKGTGKKFIKNDGKIFDFCSMKCEKSIFKLKRKPRTTRWTGEYHSVKKGVKQ